MNNADTPATAQSGFETMAGDIYNSDSCGGEGLTKREHFAAMAMQGMMSNIAADQVWSRTELADTAVSMADDLLEELAK
jgi:hypothetical protein